jgi:SAM-dependent methyltransferase
MTKHDKMSKESFEAVYKGRPPWDIGRPQRAFIDLLEHGKLMSPVLDAGCGSGELAIYAAGKGYDVLGVDFSPKAVEQADARAREARSGASFAARDMLSLAGSGLRFNTVLDCCFFHVLDDPGREKYEQTLKKIVGPGGAIYMLGFAKQFPGAGAPRAVTRQDIERTFADSWTIVSVEESQVEVNLPVNFLPGTFACLKKKG